MTRVHWAVDERLCSEGSCSYPRISGADTGTLERKMWLLDMVRAAGNAGEHRRLLQPVLDRVQDQVGTEFPV